MIKSLYIKNFALVEELTINFSDGLNILTGETGAGKTIIVTALAQLCGERSSVDFVRKGAPKAILEAEIEISENARLKQALQNLDIDGWDAPVLILRKEITARGTSRTFINDTPVPLNRLGEVSSLLIDIHGQHQHQRLLHPEHHIAYLDAFGKLEQSVARFKDLLAAYRIKVKEREALKEQQLKSSQLQDMYRFQMEELTRAGLQPGELDELYAEHKKLSNVETIHQLASAIAGLLYEGDVNAAGLIVDSEHKLDQLSEFDGQFHEFKESLLNARIAVEELGRHLQEYVAGLEFDPHRLEQIQERINHLEFLLKKYQKISIQELIDYLEEIKTFTADIDQFDEKIRQIDEQINELKQKIEQQGASLSEKRKEIARTFERQISDLLHKLGMPNARFRTKFEVNAAPEGPFSFAGETVLANERGFDRILFEFTSNAGEDFKPLHKVASGGEISRIMLSLKSILAEIDDVPTMIFDEIDSGISGKVAQIVGLRMSELSKTHQILCVTHLPQIAAFASTHFKVAKIIEDNRTLVDIKLLNDEERITEVAALLGGQKIAEQTLENARHLILEAESLKNE
ncbi:DNA repair protein RecN [Caldithrix abyssi]